MLRRIESSHFGYKNSWGPPNLWIPQHPWTVPALPKSGSWLPGFLQPLTGPRFYAALCGWIERPRQIKEEKGLISQLPTEFALFIGSNTADIKYLEKSAVEATRQPDPKSATRG